MFAPTSAETTPPAARGAEDKLIEWRDQWEGALCRDATGYSTKLFFSEEPADIALAKAICSECPVVEPCLEGATRRREPWGVWGGELFADGVILPYKRKRGRPPKISESNIAESNIALSA